MSVHGVKTVDGKVRILTETKDIDAIHLDYYCWMEIEIDALANAELFRSGQVARFWFKYSTLYMELKDGTIVKEDCIDNELNFDTKRPWKTYTIVGDDKMEEYYE